MSKVFNVRLNKYPLETKYFLSVKDKNGKDIKIEVKKEVYIYVKQLENYIKNPESSGLMNLYPKRFSGV